MQDGDLKSLILYTLYRRSFQISQTEQRLAYIAHNVFGLCVGGL
jgi:hypothetical protein